MSIEKSVAEVLKDPKLKTIDFEIEGARITGARLHEVGQAIEAGRIQLKVDASGPLLSAAYSPHQNRMTIGPKSLESGTGKSGIVHESVHALVDMFKCKSVTELGDEVCAYIAESMYLRAIGTAVKGDAAAMAIYSEAGKLASKVKKGAKIKPAAYAKLLEAIHAHPAYSGIDPHSMSSGHGIPD